MDARTAARALERVARLLEAETGGGGRTRPTSSDYRSDHYDRTAERLGERMTGALTALREGRISQGAAASRLADAIAEAYPSAYADGASRWGGARVGDADRAWIARAVRGEQGYARDFARAVAERPELSDDYVRNRVGLYVGSLDSVRTAGWVDHAPDGTMFDWVLGDAVHCRECPVLAAHGPYSKAALPTYPRAGDTPCISRCACTLEVVDHPEVQSGGPAPRDLSRPHGAVEGGGEPPPAVRAALDDARARLNYWRREIDAAEDGSDEERRAIRERQRANDEILDLQVRHGVRDVPMLSVGEVLTGRDLARPAVDEILDSGVDGEALGAMTAAERAGKLSALRDAVAALLKARGQS